VVIPGEGGQGNRFSGRRPDPWKAGAPGVHFAVSIHSLKFQFRFADNPYMVKPAKGSWYVKKKGEAVGVIAEDSSVVAVLPRKNAGEDTRIKEAYLLAAAPQLFEACTKITSILESSLIVTPEGIKINCTDVKKSLSDAILRARGCRKSPQEP
jgi:hypothetical protein